MADESGETHHLTKFVDVESFIDMHLLMELTKNVDGHRLNNYIWRSSKGVLLAGPVWDFNYSLGNAEFLNGWKRDGFQCESLSCEHYPWFSSLFADERVVKLYQNRWKELRGDGFSSKSLMHDINDAAKLLEEAQKRNFARWRILGRHITPNPTGYNERDTFEKEVNWVKEWLNRRLMWLDQEILQDVGTLQQRLSGQRNGG